MRYRLFYIAEEGHHLQKQFEDFTNRKDIKILHLHTVATERTAQCVVYYEEVDVKSEEQK